MSLGEVNSIMALLTAGSMLTALLGSELLTADARIIGASLS